MKPTPKLSREQAHALRSIQALRSLGAGLQAPQQNQRFSTPIAPSGSYLRTAQISKAAI